MKADREAFKKKFEETLVKLHPEVLETNLLTRAQIYAVWEEVGQQSWPGWLTKELVSRGTFNIKGLLEVVPRPKVAKAKTTAPAPTEEPSLVSFHSTPVIPSNTNNMVPAKSSNFVPFGHFDDIRKIVSTKVFYPIYIAGPTGNGKSTMVEQACAIEHRELIRINLNASTDEEQLIGSKTLRDGNVEIVEGPALIAMRKGATLLLDEIDAGSPNTLLCLQPILEGKPYYFKLKNEIIFPTKGFNIIATANTKGHGSDDGRYIGTNVLNEAFLERFAAMFIQDYPPERVEAKIVSKLMESLDCYDKEIANSLVKWVSAIRLTFKDGGCDELITTRRLSHIIHAYSIFGDILKAIELCCNRFDETTSRGFQDLYLKVSGLIPKEIRDTKSEEPLF